MYLFKNSKSPYYQIIFEVDGKRTTKSTKTSIKSEALKFLSEFEKRIRTEPEVKNISLKNFKSEYVSYLTGNRSKSYIRNIKLAFDQFISFAGDMPLKSVTVKTCDSFVYNLFPKSPYACHSYYRNLRAGFNVAIRWNYLLDNPFNKVKLPKIKKSFPVFINENQLQLIIEHTKEKYLKDLFFLAFHTGMRLGEIVNLQWNSVSLSEKIITVGHTETFTTKSKTERQIPINSKLFDVLSLRYPKVRRLNKPEYVFYRTPGIKLNEDYVSKKFKRAVRDAELNDKIHMHTLRHSFASNLVQAGCSLLTVQKLLGHESYKTTEIYSHLQHSNLSEAVELLTY